MCSSILSLSKIAHEMWRDHPFSQRNRKRVRTVGVGVGGDRKVGRGGGGGKKKKKKGGGVGNIGGSAPLYQLYKETS